jgi:hypothetical protein
MNKLELGFKLICVCLLIGTQNNVWINWKLSWKFMYIYAICTWMHLLYIHSCAHTHARMLDSFWITSNYKQFPNTSATIRTDTRSGRKVYRPASKHYLWAFINIFICLWVSRNENIITTSPLPCPPFVDLQLLNDNLFGWLYILLILLRLSCTVVANRPTHLGAGKYQYGTHSKWDCEIWGSQRRWGCRCSSSGL